MATGNVSFNGPISKVIVMEGRPADHDTLFKPIYMCQTFPDTKFEIYSINEGKGIVNTALYSIIWLKVMRTSG